KKNIAQFGAETALAQKTAFCEKQMLMEIVPYLATSLNFNYIELCAIDHPANTPEVG
ncbi:hypothetical protein GGX14DRAFT_316655, partial [Mycena pura]